MISHGSTVLIIGGKTQNGRTKSVIKVDSNDIGFNSGRTVDYIPYTPISDMNVQRSSHACSIMFSPVYDYRPVAVVAGSYGAGGEETAEILDFTKQGSTWQFSKYSIIDFIAV